MITPYQLIVFDWEGTLSDPLGHVHDALAAEAKRLHIGAYDPTVGRQYVSLGLDKAVRKIYPNLNMHQYEALLSGVQQTLSTSYGSVYLFPGAKALIQSLFDAGIVLAIATNKGEQSLVRALQATHLAPYFEMTASASQYASKPCPDMLEAILQTCHIPAEHVLMIGDSVSDIEMAQALGVESAGVDFYYQQADTLTAAGARMIFNDFKQISAYLGF